MKLYIASDIHGYYSIFKSSLDEAGYFKDTEPHKLVILGDLFDGGNEANELQRFVLELMDKDEVILIKGNHEDQFLETLESDGAPPFTQRVSNEIYRTALQLTGYDWIMAQLRYYDFVDDIKRTPFFERLLPAMRDYYETEHYVFTHGWIPSIREPSGTYRFYPAWRDAGQMEWKNARWINGMDAAQTAAIEGKTVICGHCHASYGHSRIEKQCSEFGADADFSPYHGPGIISIDACTSFSKKMNVLILRDSSIPE